MNNLNTKLLLILFVLSGLLNSAIAQAPEGIIYQAEARDDKGKLIANSTLDVKITIHEDNESGNIVWMGLHEVTTNSYGMFVLVIGEGISDHIFEDIEWAEYFHFLNVQVKKPKKTDWVDMGTTQLLSVPYALHAKTAEKAIIDKVNDADANPENELITGAILDGNDLKITDAGGTNIVDLSNFSSLWAKNGADINYNGGNVGIGTTSPHGQFEVLGNNATGITSVGDFVVDTENKKVFVGRLSSTPFNSSDFIVRNRLGYQTFVVSAANYISLGNYNGSQEQMRVVFDGNTFGVGIGTTTPDEKLHIAGNMRLDGTFEDKDGEAGSAGQILSSTATGTDWIAASSGSNDADWTLLGSDMFSAVSGNVGIGTTSPARRLEIVAASDNPQIRLTRMDNSNLYAEFRVDPGGNLHIDPIGGVAYLNDDEIHMWKDGSTLTNFFSVNGNSYINSGNVGIGTINPLTRLQVDGNMTFAPAGLSSDESRFIGQSIASQSTFDANMGFGGMEIENLDVDGDDDSEQQIHFWTHDQGVTSERRMTIDINGNVGIGTTTPAEKLHLYSDENTRIKFNAGGRNAHIGYNTGQFEIGTEDQDEVQIITDGQVRMYFEAFGNVGIGTTTPDEKLHVAGNMRLEGTLGDEYGNVGSPGQILSSTGTGTNWITAPEIDDTDWIISEDNMYSALSGNVGIGTTSPVSKLEIVADSDNPPLRLTRMDDSNLHAEFEIDPNGNLAIHPSGGVVFLVNDDIHMWQEDGEIMTNVFSVNGDSYFNSGNVGIGTTNPLTRLQVDGNITFAPAGLSSDESRFIGQSIASQSTFDANMGFGGMEIENLDVDGDDDSEQQIHFWTHDQGITSERRMTIDINGNVGIGTTTPAEKLHLYSDENTRIKFNAGGRNAHIGYNAGQF